VVIDFLSPRWLFWMRHGIRIDAVAGQVTSSGSRLEGRIESWSPIDYCLVFRKPDEPWRPHECGRGRHGRLRHEATRGQGSMWCVT
jgi:hypothetical protein